MRDYQRGCHGSCAFFVGDEMIGFWRWQMQRFFKWLGEGPILGQIFVFFGWVLALIIVLVTLLGGK